MPSRHITYTVALPPTSFDFSVSSTPSFPPLASSPAHVQGLVYGFGVGGGFAALVAIILLLFIVYQRVRTNGRPSKHRPSSCHKLQRFRHRELKAATQSFSSECKLGQGGFGAVFKGVLRNGREIAVKRLDTTSLQGEREFQNELSVIGDVSSPHIVCLLGFCADGKRRRLLVYEYMRNGSLQEALFDDEYPVTLNWARRLNIVLDTAKALAFLHKRDPPIIHGDVKPSNVLLDCNFSARIADFGLARLKTDIPADHECMGGQHHEKPENRQLGRSVDKEKSQRRPMEKEKRQEKESKPHIENMPDTEEKMPVRQSTSSKESPSIFTASPSSDASSFLDKQSYEHMEHENKADLYARDEAPLSESLSAGESPITEEDVTAVNSVEDTVKPGGDVSPTSHQIQKVNIKDTQTEICFDKLGMDSGKDLHFMGVKTKNRMLSSFSKDWWWRQASSGELSMKTEWMGHDSGTTIEKPLSVVIKECSPKGDQNGIEDIMLQESRKPTGGAWKEIARDRSRSSEWWGSFLQEEMPSDQGQPTKEQEKKEKCKASGDQGWQWWKEDASCCSTETSKENNSEVKKIKEKGSWRSASLEWWRDDNSGDECSTAATRSRKKSNHQGERQSRSKSREWWKDDELANSQELTSKARMKKKREQSLSREWWSGDLLSTRSGISSTPSMRGTICYIAPEYGGNGVLSEKGDVYSFGVLLLVIISGRRPLQVMGASPLTEFERANLISWARQLAQSGNLLELVDAALNGDYCREQAMLYITVALLCLQRLPAARPAMSEVVKFLSGEEQPPSLPLEFSLSPPAGSRRVLYKSRRKEQHSSSSEERVGTTHDLSSVIVAAEG